MVNEVMKEIREIIKNHNKFDDAKIEGYVKNMTD